MGGGLIQLVAYGYENIYLCGDPQITFFKVVYRRHTNFAIEQIPQSFTNTPNFGKSYSCFISKNADLVGQIYLVITLPKIRQFNNEFSKFAWVKRIGYSMIKTIEIEINGQTIDYHYGEYLSIWSELTGDFTGGNSRGLNKMIGDIPELTEFSSSKEQYTLYVPLKFWFCNCSGNAIPLVSLQYSTVKINVEFEDVKKCYKITPSHYIQCRDDIVNFIEGEYIQQNINGIINAGIFSNYDINAKRLYYYKISSNKLTSIPVASNFDSSNANITQINQILISQIGAQYTIVGQTSGYSTFPEFNNFTKIYSISELRNLNIVNCYILADYYFLDDDERMKFSQVKHDYIIEQLYFTPDILINGNMCNANIIVEHPCKLMIWLVQMNYIYDAKDLYNYTDSYINNSNKPIGKNLINSQTILLNGNTRLSLRNASYFDNVQIFQNFKNNISHGLNIYSFSMYPLMKQPYGSCNMSQIDLVQISMKLSNIINVNNPASFRCYSSCYNVLRITNGLAGLVFSAK